MHNSLCMHLFQTFKQSFNDILNFLWLEFIFFLKLVKKLLLFFSGVILLLWVKRQSKENFMIKRLRTISWCFCDWVAS
jgi:hypothetical protein